MARPNRVARAAWLPLLCIFASVCLGDPGNRGFGDVALFRSELERDGFVVREGMLNKADLLLLFTKGILPSCYAYNFDSPYCFNLMPELPEQKTFPNKPNTYPWTYRLRADEAIVFVGWTPPEVKYFGYQTYLASRYHPVYNRELRFFVNVGDAINNFTIQTGDGPGGQARAKPYDAAAMIISTPDSGIDARVRKAALAAGCSEAAINTEIIPSQLVRFGLDSLSDELAFVNRIAFFVDDAEGKVKDAYFSADRVLVNADGTLVGPPYGPNARGWVFRVTPAAALETRTLKPFSMPRLRVRGTGDTREFDLLPALDKLRNAVIEHYYNPGITEYEELTTWIWIPDGYDQYQQKEFFTLGPTNDTIYLRCTQFQLGQDSTDFVVVYGLNHALTGKSTYSSLVLYSEDPVPGVPSFADRGELAGLASVNSERTDGKGLRGSAERFEPFFKDAVPDTAKDPEKFYVWKIARRANSEPFCLTVPDPSPSPRLRMSKFLVGFRAYVEPETKVGPAWSEIVYDRVIHFKPKTSGVLGSRTERALAPGCFALSQNYPNPCNGNSVIDYSVSEPCTAVLEIFGLDGRIAARYAARGRPECINRFIVDVNRLASGIYSYRLKAAGRTAVKKLLVVK